MFFVTILRLFGAKMIDDKDVLEWINELHESFHYLQETVKFSRIITYFCSFIILYKQTCSNNSTFKLFHKQKYIIINTAARNVVVSTKLFRLLGVNFV